MLAQRMQKLRDDPSNFIGVEGAEEKDLEDDDLEDLTTLLSNKWATDRRNDILPEPLDDEEEPEPAQPSVGEGAKSSPVVVVVMPQKARPRRRRRRVTLPPA